MTNDDNFTQKNAYKFDCVCCDFKCCNKYDYKRHLSTLKHLENDFSVTNNDAKNAKNAKDTKNEKNTITKKFNCDCGKSYKYRQGLFSHKKNCQIITNQNENNTDDGFNDKELIMSILQQNKYLQEQIIEMCKEKPYIGNINNSNNTITNSNNKSFNLQFFLNETCKDAMNITEFVDSIKFQLSDLESVGELGYVKGISNIIVKNLNALDVTQRPVHCADKKREVLYIKDDNKWEKEDEDSKKLRKMIKRVAFKNYKQITQFKAKHPDCNTSESKYSDKYNKIIIESMGGEGDNEKENEDKIIRNISKEVVIDKVTLSQN